MAAIRVLGAILLAAASLLPAGRGASAATIVANDGALHAGMNAVVWQDEAGQPSPPAELEPAIGAIAEGLSLDAGWLLRSGAWEYYLPALPPIGTLKSLPPLAALIVVMRDTGSELRPNLVALPPIDLLLERDVAGRLQLRFTTRTWNAGAGPLELVLAELSPLGEQQVSQRIYRADGTSYERLAGTYEYHPGHGHVHFANFARYTLERLDGPAPLSISAKVSFCVADFARYASQTPNSPPTPHYTECEQGTQGLSVGYLDIYDYTLPDQSFDVSNLPSGRYRLANAVDPDGRLFEQPGAKSDNTSAVVIDIDVPNGRVTVVPSPP